MFQLERGRNWTPELHRAAVEYERAADMVVSGKDAPYNLEMLRSAQRRFGALMLALDRMRRPQFYRRQRRASGQKRETK